MIAAPLQPWPSDAWMIVAANAGEERRERMEGPHPCLCRSCGTRLVADTYSVRVAMQHPLRCGRPVRFFCVACCTRHDRSTIEVLIDHRGRKASDATRN